MEFLTLNMPAEGSQFASVTGPIDTLGILDTVLMHYRDAAPTEQWRGVVVDAQFGIRHALRPYTYEDDGGIVVTAEFPRAAIAVVAEAAAAAESQYRAIREIA